MRQKPGPLPVSRQRSNVKTVLAGCLNRACPFVPIFLSLQAIENASNILRNAGFTDISQEVLKARIYPVVDFEDELEVMAEVRAYFQVAYKVSDLVRFYSPESESYTMFRYAVVRGSLTIPRSPSNTSLFASSPMACINISSGICLSAVRTPEKIALDYWRRIRLSFARGKSSKRR